jgi:hypothetical protein
LTKNDASTVYSPRFPRAPSDTLEKLSDKVANKDSPQKSKQNQLAEMAGMTMHMHLRAPIGKAAAPAKAMATTLPRCAGLPSGKQSAFFAGSAAKFSKISARAPTQTRTARLIVVAAKKSIGDLSKGELEGKVVLVSSSHIRPAHTFGDNRHVVHPHSSTQLYVPLRACDRSVLCLVAKDIGSLGSIRMNLIVKGILKAFCPCLIIVPTLRRLY